MDNCLVNCIACGKTIEVTERNLIKCWDGEYITCPHCKRSISVQSYINKERYANKTT